MRTQGLPRRVAALGGSYGNVAALEACLDDARAQGAEVVAFLGDSIGCCGQSEEVLAVLRERVDVRVAGNHEQQAAARAETCGCGYSSPDDEAVSCEAFRLATEALSDASRAWVASWPERAFVETQGGRVLLCHGSPGHTSEFLYEHELDDLRLEAWLDRFEARGFVCTHSGLHWVRRLRGGRFAVNCGAVGKADHDGDPAVHYALLDCPADGDVTIEMRRVAYDHEAQAQRMERVGIAPVFVEPIRTGIWTTGVASLPPSERHRYLRASSHAHKGLARREWKPEALDESLFARTLREFRALALVTEGECAEVMGLFDPAFPFFEQARQADSVHLHVRVNDTRDLPRGAIHALGTSPENEREGYVKFSFKGGINVIFSSIDVADEDRLPIERRPRPHLDHYGIDLRREVGVVRASFEDVPSVARRAGWAHVPQGGGARAVFCCHVQVAAKHWVYPPLDATRWTRPVEFAYGPLRIQGDAMGCDLRPIDPRHPCAGDPALCAPPAP